MDGVQVRPVIAWHPFAAVFCLLIIPLVRLNASSSLWLSVVFLSLSLQLISIHFFSKPVSKFTSIYKIQSLMVPLVISRSVWV